MDQLQITQHKNGRTGLTYTYEENVGSRIEWDGENRHGQVTRFEQHTDWVLPPDYDQVTALEVPGWFHVSVYGQHGLFLFQSPPANPGSGYDAPPMRWKHLLYENTAIGARAGFLIEPACPSLSVHKLGRYPLYQVEARANNNILTEAGTFLIDTVNEDIVQISERQFVVKNPPRFSLYTIVPRGVSYEMQLLLDDNKWGKFYKEAQKISVSTAELDKLEARWKVSRSALSGLFG